MSDCEVWIDGDLVFGAFAAHSLKSQISEDSIKSFETGVRYMMYHGLAIIILSTLKFVSRQRTFGNRSKSFGNCHKIASDIISQFMYLSYRK